MKHLYFVLCFAGQLFFALASLAALLLNVVMGNVAIALVCLVAFLGFSGGILWVVRLWGRV